MSACDCGTGPFGGHDPDCNRIMMRRRPPHLVDGCEACDRLADGEMGPSHNGSTRCESFSIASGGHREHCTCDVCF